MTKAKKAIEGDIEVGDTARDKVTGAEGIVVAKTHYLTSCDRISVQGKVGADGKIPEWISFDISVAELLEKETVKPNFEVKQVRPEGKKEGGPQPSAQRAVPSVSR